MLRALSMQEVERVSGGFSAVIDDPQFAYVDWGSMTGINGYYDPATNEAVFDFFFADDGFDSGYQSSGVGELAAVASSQNGRQTRVVTTRTTSVTTSSTSGVTGSVTVNLTVGGRGISGTVNFGGAGSVGGGAGGGAGGGPRAPQTPTRKK